VIATALDIPPASAYGFAMALPQPLPPAFRPHVRHLRALARENRRRQARADEMPGKLRAAAQVAHADGMPISQIAEALGCSRYYAHTLVHGRVRKD
jgi:DNA-directed RNA polymerase specialized sigma24 family protein